MGKPAEKTLKTKTKPPENDMLMELANQRAEFLNKQKSEKILKKGEGREEQTLAMLANFNSKITSMFSTHDEGEGEDEDVKDEDESWMCHRLKFVDSQEDAKDANMKDGDWYDIYDPRNSVTKRRREESENK